MKAPVGLLSDRTVLRSKMEGLAPTSSYMFFLDKHPGIVLSLLHRDRISADGTLWSTTVQGWRESQCRPSGQPCAIAAQSCLFVVGSCFYKQGALNGGIFCPQTRRFFAAILTDCKGKQRRMRAKRPFRRRAMLVKTTSKGGCLMKTDIEIAQEAKMRPITEIAASWPFR